MLQFLDWANVINVKLMMASKCTTLSKGLFFVTWCLYILCCTLSGQRVSIVMWTVDTNWLVCVLVKEWVKMLNKTVFVWLSVCLCVYSWVCGLFYIQYILVDCKKNLTIKSFGGQKFLCFCTNFRCLYHDMTLHWKLWFPTLLYMNEVFVVRGLFATCSVKALSFFLIISKGTFP